MLKVRHDPDPSMRGPLLLVLVALVSALAGSLVTASVLLGRPPVLVAPAAPARTAALAPAANEAAGDESPSQEDAASVEDDAEEADTPFKRQSARMDQVRAHIRAERYDAAFAVLSEAWKLKDAEDDRQLRRFRVQILRSLARLAEDNLDAARFVRSVQQDAAARYHVFSNEHDLQIALIAAEGTKDRYETRKILKAAASKPEASTFAANRTRSNLEWLLEGDDNAFVPRLLGDPTSYAVRMRLSLTDRMERMENGPEERQERWMRWSRRELGNLERLAEVYERHGEKAGADAIRREAVFIREALEEAAAG